MANTCESCQFAAFVNNATDELATQQITLREVSDSLWLSASAVISEAANPELLDSIPVAGLAAIDQDQERVLDETAREVSLANDAIEIINAGLSDLGSIECDQPLDEAAKCPKVLRIMAIATALQEVRNQAK